VCASVGSANNINKLSLVGMQLPEKYKENFDVSSEGPSSAKRRKSPYIYIHTVHVCRIQGFISAIPDPRFLIYQPVLKKLLFSFISFGLSRVVIHC
jgi:hypothetical protein